MALAEDDKAALRDLPDGQEILKREEDIAKPSMDFASTLFWLELWAAIISTILLLVIIVFPGNRRTSDAGLGLTITQKVVSIVGHSMGCFAIKLLSTKMFITSTVLTAFEILLHGARIAVDSRLVDILLTKVLALVYDIVLLIFKFLAYGKIRKLAGLAKLQAKVSQRQKQEL